MGPDEFSLLVQVVMKYTNLGEYISVADVFVEYILQNCTVSKLKCKQERLSNAGFCKSLGYDSRTDYKELRGNALKSHHRACNHRKQKF